LGKLLLLSSAQQQRPAILSLRPLASYPNHQQQHILPSFSERTFHTTAPKKAVVDDNGDKLPPNQGQGGRLTEEDLQKWKNEILALLVHLRESELAVETAMRRTEDLVARVQCHLETYDDVLVWWGILKPRTEEERREGHRMLQKYLAEDRKRKKVSTWETTPPAGSSRCFNKGKGEALSWWWARLWHGKRER